MKYCTNCGKLLEEDVSFCPKCGRKVADEAMQSSIASKTVNQERNICSIFAIVFGAVGIIFCVTGMVMANFVFLPIAFILAIIGLFMSKGRKKGAMIASTVVVGVYIVLSAFWALPIIWGRSVINVPDDTSSSINSAPVETSYMPRYEGEAICTDFITITIDEISTAHTIKSIDSSVVLNASSGEQYLYISGTITNTSGYTYDVGSLGSASYGNTTSMIDCELEFRNGDIKYGTLLTDNGGIYGLTSDGIISPQQTVKYYFAFTIVDGLNIKNNDFSLNSRITITFMEGLKEKPKYNHADCDYRYEIKIN